MRKGITMLPSSSLSFIGRKRELHLSSLARENLLIHGEDEGANPTLVLFSLDSFRNSNYIEI